MTLSYAKVKKNVDFDFLFCMVIELTYATRSKRYIHPLPKNNRSTRNSIRNSTNSLLNYDESILHDVDSHAKHGKNSTIISGESLSPEQWRDLLTPDTWLSSDHINIFLYL